MDYRYATKHASGYDNGLRAFMQGVFNKMFLGLGVTGVTAWMVASNPQLVYSIAKGPMWLFFLAEIAITVYLTARLHKMKILTAFNLFITYAVITGITLAPIGIAFTGESIAGAFMATAGFFGAMSLIGYTTKKDLTSVGTFMIAGLMALILASILNYWFFKSTGFSMMLSVAGIIIFAGLTAFDVQNLKKIYSLLPNDEMIAKYSIFGAFQLYLDFINMFVYLLRIFGNRRS